MATYRATTFVYIASFCVFFSSRFRGTNSFLDVYFDELDGEIFLCSCCRIEDPHFDVVTQRNFQMIHEVRMVDTRAAIAGIDAAQSVPEYIARQKLPGEVVDRYVGVCASGDRYG